jgi:hypothetical protein
VYIQPACFIASNFLVKDAQSKGPIHRDPFGWSQISDKVYHVLPMMTASTQLTLLSVFLGIGTNLFFIWGRCTPLISYLIPFVSCKLCSSFKKNFSPSKRFVFLESIILALTANFLNVAFFLYQFAGILVEIVVLEQFYHCWAIADYFCSSFLKDIDCVEKSISIFRGKLYFPRRSSDFPRF